MSSETKLCAFCKEDKSINEFWRNSSAKDGRQGYCKTCCALYSAARRQGNEGKLQAGCAYHCALEDLKAQKIHNMADMLKALRRPKVYRVLSQIKITDLFADLKGHVPANAMVPFGYDFAD